MEITLKTVTLPKTRSVRSQWAPLLETAQVGQGMEEVPAAKRQAIKNAAKAVLHPRGLDVAFRTVKSEKDAEGKTVATAYMFSVVERKPDTKG